MQNAKNSYRGYVWGIPVTYLLRDTLIFLLQPPEFPFFLTSSAFLFFHALSNIYSEALSDGGILSADILYALADVLWHTCGDGNSNPQTFQNRYTRYPEFQQLLSGLLSYTFLHSDQSS